MNFNSTAIQRSTDVTGKCFLGLLEKAYRARPEIITAARFLTPSKAREAIKEGYLHRYLNESVTQLRHFTESIITAAPSILRLDYVYMFTRDMYMSIYKEKFYQSASKVKNISSSFFLEVQAMCLDILTFIRSHTLPKGLTNWWKPLGPLVKSSTKTMFLNTSALAKRHSPTNTATYQIVGARFQEVLGTLNAWYHGFCHGLQQVAQFPRNAWAAVTGVFRAFIDGIHTAFNVTLRTVKSVLWIAFICLTVIALLQVAVKVSPYLVRSCQRLLAKRYERQERARRQRILEEQRVEDEENARREEARTRRLFEAQRRRAEEEALRAHEARRLKVLEEQQRRRHEQEAIKWIRQCLVDWESQWEDCHNNIESTRTFPEPQMGTCDREECRAGNQFQEIKICQHNLEKLLRSSANYEAMLRKAMINSHPDRFSRAADSVKEELTRKATVMFQMLQNLPSK